MKDVVHQHKLDFLYDGDACSDVQIATVAMSHRPESFEFGIYTLNQLRYFLDNPDISVHYDEEIESMSHILSDISFVWLYDNEIRGNLFVSKIQFKIFHGVN